MECDEDCVIVSEGPQPRDKLKKSVSPAKCKQARLPFTPIVSKPKYLEKNTKPLKMKGETLPIKSKNDGDIRQKKSKKRRLSNSETSISSKKPAYEKIESDAEVSSSCDEVSSVPRKICHANETNKSAKETNQASSALNNFITREPTQQAEVSTSVMEDEKLNAAKEAAGVEEEVLSNEKDESGTLSNSSNKNQAESNSLNGLKRAKMKLKEFAWTPKDGEKNPSSNSECLDTVIDDSLNKGPIKKLKIDTNIKLYEQEDKSNAHDCFVKSASKTNLISSFIIKETSGSLKEHSEKNCSKEEASFKSELHTAEGKSVDRSVDVHESIVSSNTDCDSVTLSVSIISAEVATTSSCEDSHDKSVCEELSKLVSPTSKTAQTLFTNSSKKCNKMTPTMVERQLQKQKKDDEKARKKEEKLKIQLQKEEEKARKVANRERLKKEKEEEQRKLKEEKEQHREEKLKKKQEELEAKKLEREEKKLKLEEERKLKEEEKKKREEAKKAKENKKKRLQQEEEERNRKAVEKFTNFFTASKPDLPSFVGNKIPEQTGHFQQMQVGRFTALAPVNRVTLDDAAKKILEEALVVNTSECYLKLLHTGRHIPRRDERTPRPVHATTDKDEDCVIIDEKDASDDDDDDDVFSEGACKVVFSGNKFRNKKYRAKLLQFCENRRPAYWGTWSKISVAVRPRRPFATDKIFDYEYDSDDDWEEEEENGESLSDSDGERDPEEDDQYEIDNDFFVPHGYLSDNEGQETIDEEDGAVKYVEDTPEGIEAHKLSNQAKLKAKQAEFEKELKRQTKQLKPRVLGCFWLHDTDLQSGPAIEHLVKVLSCHAAVICNPDCRTTDSKDSSSQSISIPCLPPTPPDSPVRPAMEDRMSEDLTGKAALVTSSTGLSKGFLKVFPEEAVAPFIKLLHGNRHNKVFLCREFAEYWRNQQQNTDSGDPEVTRLPAMSTKTIKEKLHELAEYRKCPEKGPFFKQRMWYVSEEIRQKHGIENVSVTNVWTYSLTPKSLRGPQDMPSNVAGSCEAPVVKASLNTPARTNLITQFTKVLTDEEKMALRVKKQDLGKMLNNSEWARSLKEYDDDLICLDDLDEKFNSEKEETKLSCAKGEKFSVDGKITKLTNKFNSKISVESSISSNVGQNKKTGEFKTRKTFKKCKTVRKTSCTTGNKVSASNTRGENISIRTKKKAQVSSESEKVANLPLGTPKEAMECDNKNTLTGSNKSATPKTTLRGSIMDFLTKSNGTNSPVSCLAAPLLARPKQDEIECIDLD